MLVKIETLSFRLKQEGSDELKLAVNEIIINLNQVETINRDYQISSEQQRLLKDRGGEIWKIWFVNEDWHKRISRNEVRRILEISEKMALGKNPFLSGEIKQLFFLEKNETEKAVSESILVNLKKNLQAK